MLKRKPSNVSEKEKHQKPKVRWSSAESSKIKPLSRKYTQTPLGIYGKHKIVKWDVTIILCNLVSKRVLDHLHLKSEFRWSTFWVSIWWFVRKQYYEILCNLNGYEVVRVGLTVWISLLKSLVFVIHLIIRRLLNGNI